MTTGATSSSACAAGSATPGEDYVPAAGTLVYAPGETWATIEVLLLDESMAGMNLEETEDMARFILNVNRMWSVSLILVEHDMGVVMDISKRLCVLEFGQKIAEGSPREIQGNPQVVRAYLGEDEKAYSRL